MNVLLDCRENNNDFNDAFEDYCSQLNLEVKKQQLIAGDIVFNNIIIERKTASDFISSIIDQRLQEQQQKMMQYEFRYIVIIGDIYKIESKINKHALIGKITSLLIKYGIKVIYTQNEIDGAYACFSILKKHLEENEIKEFQFNIQKFTDEDIVFSMIYQIPGLGIEKAKEIAKLHNNCLNTFVNCFKEKEVSELEGVGKVTINKIKEIIGKGI